MNLLDETREFITDSEHEPSDIQFIGSLDGEYSMTWEEFTQIANVEYDESGGAQEVAKDLIVRFKDGACMTREEYDGAEWWKYNMTEPMYGKGKPINTLVRGIWESVKEMQEPK